MNKAILILLTLIAVNTSIMSGLELRKVLSPESVIKDQMEGTLKLFE